MKSSLLYGVLPSYLNPSLLYVFPVAQPTEAPVNSLTLSPIPSCQRFDTSPQTPDSLRSIFHFLLFTLCVTPRSRVLRTTAVRAGFIRPHAAFRTRGKQNPKPQNSGSVCVYWEVIQTNFRGGGGARSFGTNGEFVRCVIHKKKKTKRKQRSCEIENSLKKSSPQASCDDPIARSVRGWACMFSELHLQIVAGS